MYETSKFEALNFDTHPSNAGYEEVEVEVDTEKIIEGYGEAYAHELHRRNPLKFEASTIINDKTLTWYFEYLVFLRLQSVNGVCKDFRLARSLMIPDWIAFVLDKLGKVYLTNMGLCIKPKVQNTVPKFESEDQSEKVTKAADAMKFAQQISVELRSFIADGVGMSDNALSRSEEGDVDVMSSILVNDYIHSIKEVTPIKTYVAAFLGLKLLGETKWEALFRIRYDDVNYIRSRILGEGSLF